MSTVAAVAGIVGWSQPAGVRDVGRCADAAAAERCPPVSVYIKIVSQIVSSSFSKYGQIKWRASCVEGYHKQQHITQSGPADEAQRKREERNRKQREYRARKRAESNRLSPSVATPNNGNQAVPSFPTPVNANKHAYSPVTPYQSPSTPYQDTVTATTANGNHYTPYTPVATPVTPNHSLYHPMDVDGGQLLPSVSGVSSNTSILISGASSVLPEARSVQNQSQSNVCQLTPVAGGTENDDPDDSTEWLHRNANYFRPLEPKSTMLGSYATAQGSSKDKALKSRERYVNMDDTKKEKLLQNIQDYKKKIIRGVSKHPESSIPTPILGAVTEEQEVVHVPRPPKENGKHNDIEFDSGLFEPTHLQSDAEGDNLGATQNVDIADSDDDDDEPRHRSGEGDEFESYRVYVNGVDVTDTEDPYDYIYHNLPDRHHVLLKVPDCQHCGAKRFQYEPPAFCCRKGKIKIHIPEVPTELKRLFTSQVDADVKYFRKDIRYFNSHFSFTSLGVTLDRRVSTAAGTGIYTFRVHGALYHRLDPLVRGFKRPRHLQLYFYDTEDHTLSHRVQRSHDLDINLIRNILRILQDNPYVETFKRVGAIPNLDDYRIELNTNVTPDQRRYNAPTASQVAAIWCEGSDPQRSFDRSVIVYAKGDRPRYVRAYHGCFDPLSYPLFFPRGETGWDRFMPYNGPPVTRDGNPASSNVPVREETISDEPIDHAEVENQLDDDVEGDNDIQEGDYLSRVEEIGYG
ncbi:hypothetical protein ACP4OV_029563 [Aristida adscensionis]